METGLQTRIQVIQVQMVDGHRSPSSANDLPSAHDLASQAGGWLIMKQELLVLREGGSEVAQSPRAAVARRWECLKSKVKYTLLGIYHALATH